MGVGVRVDRADPTSMWKGKGKGKGKEKEKVKEKVEVKVKVKGKGKGKVKGKEKVKVRVKTSKFKTCLVALELSHTQHCAQFGRKQDIIVEGGSQELLCDCVGP